MENITILLITSYHYQSLLSQVNGRGASTPSPWGNDFSHVNRAAIFPLFPPWPGERVAFDFMTSTKTELSWHLGLVENNWDTKFGILSSAFINLEIPQVCFEICTPSPYSILRRPILNYYFNSWATLVLVESVSYICATFGCMHVVFILFSNTSISSGADFTFKTKWT